MTDPYRILGIDQDADDAAVEAAYLAGIKRCPPERDPARFEALRTAYEALRTRRNRLAYELFDTAPPTPVDLLHRAGSFRPSQRPDVALVQAVLRGED